MPEDVGYDSQYQDLQNRLDVQRAARFKEMCIISDRGDPVCSKCLAEYQQDPRARTRLGPSFAPTCRLSTTQQIAGAEKSEWWPTLSDTEKANFKLVTDPVYWAEVRLKNHDDPDTPFRPRWYQLEPLRCTARRMLLRYGRQTGKSESLCTKILHRLDTRAGCKIILVCPFQTQASLIFGRLEAFINASPDLKARLRRKRENPVHEIEFDNGSYVRLFTAGVQTGKGGSDVRGQPADVLVLDEMDLLDDKTVDAVFATLISAKDPEIWISSTPTGKKGHFFEWATDPSHGFRSLHYTSMVSPTWSQETELLMRKTYTQAAFACEYLAEFGFVEAGVFRRQDLDAPGVIVDYDIENPVPLETEIYGMGVDWNMKGTGGVIMLVGYGKQTHKLRVAYREVVDPAEFTQLSTVQRIERLNRVWKPRFIYVDKGYGSTQIELLERYGLENHDSGLAKKVHGIDMKGNLEIRDPLTKKMVKKQAKNLMIELAVSRVEALQCIFPKSEDYRRGLLGQMREYKIEYVGRGGTKVFTGENEHLLTAWALSILGFMMEIGDIVRYQSTPEVIALDSNLQRFTELKAKADRVKIPERTPRTNKKPTLGVVDTINYAKSGIPDPVRRRLQAESLSPLGRRKWR